MEGLEGLVALLWVGGGAALVAAVLTYVFGRTGSRIVLLLVSGGIVLFAWWLFFNAAGYYEEDSGCSDCGWGELIAFVTLVGNAIGWAVGVAVGAGARYLADRRRQPRAAVS
jgi:hypothetical protein